MRKFRVKHVMMSNTTNRFFEGAIVSEQDLLNYTSQYITQWAGNVERFNETYNTQIEEIFETKKETNMVDINKVYTKQMIEKMGIERVIINNEATIVELTDGRKGVAVRDGDDCDDVLVGFAVAYAYAVGTDGNKSQMKANMRKLDKHGGFKKPVVEEV